jgi:hypothetical protein
MFPIHRARNRRADRWPRAGFAPAAAPGAASTVIPFDQAARFELTGRPGNVLQDVITVGPDGIFVAVAIGYGLDEQRTEPTPLLRLDRRDGVVPGDVTLGELPVSALLDGFRISQGLGRVVFDEEDVEPRGRGAIAEPVLSDNVLPPVHALGNAAGTARLLFESIAPPGDFAFLLSATDTATGRELQDEPTHSLASLGKSDGDRPFRMLAQPVTFLPRSSIRIQITERSERVLGTLFIVLYGYKVIAAGCPEPNVRQLRGPRACPVETIGRPNARVIPFDYVTTFRLIGQEDRLVEDEVSINSDGMFVATAIGYGLEVEGTDVLLSWENLEDVGVDALRANLRQNRAAFDAWNALAPADPAKAQLPVIDLSSLPLRMLPTSALVDGVRIRPDFIRLAMTDGGDLSRAVPITIINRMFERLNDPADVSFRYSIFDSGRGVELQNQPIHNIAGLGIADGTRPFKKLPRPMVFLPRSTIRVRVEERRGRGTLFIVFQGYKVLGDSGSRGAA